MLALLDDSFLRGSAPSGSEERKRAGARPRAGDILASCLPFRIASVGTSVSGICRLVSEDNEVLLPASEMMTSWFF